MPMKLTFLAHSLQDSSLALSKLKVEEQAQMQEAVGMLLGGLLLDGVSEPVLVKSLHPAELSERATRDGGQVVAEMLPQIKNLALVDHETANFVLITRVGDEDEWTELPVHFQNFVKGRHLPAHLMVAVQQQVIEGDTRHRHYALPVFAVMATRASGKIESEYFFSDARLRAEAGANRALDASAAKDLEPYLRLFLSHLYLPEGVSA